MDCGCMYKCYSSDITRTFPVARRFTPKQEQLYKIVYEASEYAMTFCKPGADWVEAHFATQRKILEGLREIGMVKKEGDFEEQMKVGVPAVFLVHGLGHQLGMGCHDVVRKLDMARKDPNDFRSKYLRYFGKLEPGMVITVEPGIYFVKHFLDMARSTPELAKHIDFDAVEEYSKCGGFRLEDDVVITADGYHLLPAPPKDLQAIYKLRDLAYAK